MADQHRLLDAEPSGELLDKSGVLPYSPHRRRLGRQAEAWQVEIVDRCRSITTGIGQPRDCRRRAAPAMHDNHGSRPVACHIVSHGHPVDFYSFIHITAKYRAKLTIPCRIKKNIGLKNTQKLNDRLKSRSKYALRLKTKGQYAKIHII